MWFTIFILFLQVDHSQLLLCDSEQNDKACSVNCTATVYKGENCSDVFLSERHPNLYQQEYWPQRPHDVQLIPILDGYPGDSPEYLLPGFILELYPPNSVSIQYIRGFQVDVLELESHIWQCIIVQISNVPLSSEHRQNKLKFVMKIYPLEGPTDFVFTIWSLPKPPLSVIDTNRVRYGKTSKNGLILHQDDSADWVTTISYHNNLQENYIQIWFVSAPEQYNILEYNVSLQRISETEPVSNARISRTKYTFWDVEPGKYRAKVLPYDDKSDTLSYCKCKKHGSCHTCSITVTSVINVPEDIPSITTQVNTQYLSPTTSKGQLKTITKLLTSTDIGMIDNSTAYQLIDSMGNPYVLPSAIGLVAFILVVLLVIGFNKCRRYPEFKPTRKTVTIVCTEENDCHNKMVHCFATFLQIICHLNVLYYPWTPHENKCLWIVNTLIKSDYILLVISQYAVDKYVEWTRNDNKESHDLFITTLKMALDRSMTKKLIAMKFDSTVVVPSELCTKQFLMNSELKEFLYHIHDYNITNTHPNNYNTNNTNPPLIPDIETSNEGRNLKSAIEESINVIQPIYRANSNDSGCEDDEISLRTAITLYPDNISCYKQIMSCYYDPCTTTPNEGDIQIMPWYDPYTSTSKEGAIQSKYHRNCQQCDLTDCDGHSSGISGSGP